MKHNPIRKGRVRRGDPDREQSWRDTVNQFRASGQSVRQFCTARQIKETAFYFWRRELQRRDTHAGTRPSHRAPRPLAFAKVLLPPPQRAIAESAVRLVLGGGRELLLPASWPIEQLAALIRAIGAAA